MSISPDANVGKRESSTTVRTQTTLGTTNAQDDTETVLDTTSRRFSVVDHRQRTTEIFILSSIQIPFATNTNNIVSGGQMTGAANACQ